MVKKSKKVLEETEIDVEAFYKTFTPSYSDETMEKLYLEGVIEKEKLHKVLIEAREEVLERSLTAFEKKELVKRINIEEVYVKAITYIKERIFHGYDSKFYVACKNKNGSYMVKEYSCTDFNSTFQKYFKEDIQTWFNSYSKKYTLEIDNTKPRTYTEDGTNYLNLFSGYRFNKNDVRDEERIKKGKDGVDFIWNHILHIWNSSDVVQFKYDQNWIRKLIAGFKMTTMLYLKSKMGRGKGKIINFIMEILGKQVCLPLTNDKCFTGEFNGPLMGMAFCCLDEIVQNNDLFMSLYNILKPYITEPTMSYRNLYEKIKSLMNLTSFIMTGNSPMLKLDSSASGDDRRLKVNQMSDEVKDRAYCEKLDAYVIDEDVIYSFFWDCIDNHDSKWNEQAELKLLPMTETKEEMVQQSLDTFEQYLKAEVNNCYTMDVLIKPSDLYAKYEAWVSTKLKRSTPLNYTSFIKRLDSSSFIILHKNVRNGGNPTNYILIDRIKLIKLFNEKHYFSKYDDVYEKIDEKDSELDEVNTIHKFKKEYDAKIKEMEINHMKQIAEYQSINTDLLKTVSLFVEKKKKKKIIITDALLVPKACKNDDYSVDDDDRDCLDKFADLFT